MTDRVNGVRFGRKSDQAASKLGHALRRASIEQEFDDARHIARGRCVEAEPDVDAPDEPPPGWGRS